MRILKLNTTAYVYDYYQAAWSMQAVSMNCNFIVLFCYEKTISKAIQLRRQNCSVRLSFTFEICNILDCIDYIEQPY